MKLLRFPLTLETPSVNVKQMTENFTISAVMQPAESLRMSRRHGNDNVLAQAH